MGEEKKPVYRDEMCRGLTSGSLPESQQQEKGFIGGLDFASCKGIRLTGWKVYENNTSLRVLFSHLISQCFLSGYGVYWHNEKIVDAIKRLENI